MPDEPQIFLCSSCGWKKVCPPGQSGLLELANDSMSARKFRCPSCGRAVAPRKFPNPQAEVERKASEEAARSEHDEWLAKSADYQRNFLEGKDGQGDD